MAGKPQLFHVALVAPAGRPFELRYHCPIEKRKVRRSTGTFNRKEAEEQQKNLAAQLRAGTYARPAGPSIGWEEFRARYDLDELRVHHREAGARQYNGVLDAFTAIVKPQTLEQAVTAEAMLKFRNAYAAGEHSRFGSRSAHTVISSMAALTAIFRWAKVVFKLPHDVPELPRFRPPAKKRDAKGRPLSDEEVKRFIAAVPQVVGESAAASWIELINGMLESSLRLEEAMELSWDDRTKIRPKWKDGLATIVFPGEEQKNQEDDEIPMPPGFERMLLKTPAAKRHGYIFNPLGLDLPRPAGGRKPGPGRVSADWAGKILTRIGEAAGVVVEPAKGTPPAAVKPAPKPKRKKGVVNKRKRKSARVTRSKTYTPPKFASAHDLRRTCAERMIDAGVDPMIVSRVMRHKSFETTKKFYAKGNLQKAAERLRAAMG